MREVACHGGEHVGLWSRGFRFKLPYLYAGTVYNDKHTEWRSLQEEGPPHVNINYFSVMFNK